jgi:riboflavin synthase
MFTGIIETVGTITRVTAGPGGRRLGIDVGAMASECGPGASVCVSGVCLTVAKAAPPVLEFDVVAETLTRSTLGDLTTGARVNLERSLRVGDRLDGHFVQGHVDGKAKVARVVSSSGGPVVWFAPDSSLMAYIIPKGSIAIDGVSLTVAAVEGGAFSVALIPTTLGETTLSALRAGDYVNLETDIIVRTVVARLSSTQAPEGITLETLKEAGYA